MEKLKEEELSSMNNKNIALKETGWIPNPQ